MPVSTFITNPDNQYNRVLLDPYELILLVIGIIGIYFDQTWLVVVCILVYMFGGNMFGIKEYQRKGDGRTLMEDLIFETDKIIIGVTEVDLKTLKNLKIQVWDYDGERVRIVGGTRIRLAKGIENVLEFEINGVKYSRTFYLESKIMKAELGELFKTWYANGIVFQEFDKKVKSYGLKPGKKASKKA